MKERIVLEKHELYKLLDCLPMPMITDKDLEKQIKEGRKIVLFGKERKAEQVPETYEELRSLCIEISTKEDHIHIFNDWGTNNEFLMTHSLKFYPDGTICVNGDNEFIIAKNKTVAEMWNIIRALLEVKK